MHDNVHVIFCLLLSIQKVSIPFYNTDRDETHWALSIIDATHYAPWAAA